MKLMGFLILNLMLLNQSFATSSAKLEETLNLSLTEINDYFEYITEMGLKVESTDEELKAGNLSANFFATTKPLLSNADEKLKLSAQVQTKITEVDSNNKRLDISGEINIEGRSLLVLKNIAEVFGECDIISVDDIKENTEHLNNILCYIMDSIREADRVTDLEKGLQSAANYAKQVYGDQTESEILAKVFSSLKITPTETEILASLNLDTELFGATLTSELRIKESGLFLSFKGEAEFSNDEYQTYLTQALEVVDDLADPDSDLHNNLKEQFYLIFGLLEAFLLPIEEDF